MLDKWYFNVVYYVKRPLHKGKEYESNNREQSEG